MKKAIISVAAAIAALSGSAFAGEYIIGYGESVKEAQEVALDNALAKVKSRGRGCIGYASGKNPVERPVKDGDLWSVRVHISHHNGSCKIKQDVLENFKRESGIDLKKIL